MYITSFYADGFRNLHQVRFEPDRRFNLIIGDNAQGKTNLLDAIWLMTGCKNFHGAKERHYLGFDAEFFACDMRFHDDRREQRIAYSVERGAQRKRKITINGVDSQKTGGLFEAFHCVAFSPSDVEIVNGAPDKRRSFMDLCACQLHPSSMQYVSRGALLLVDEAHCRAAKCRQGTHPETRCHPVGCAAGAGGGISLVHARKLRQEHGAAL